MFVLDNDLKAEPTIIRDVLHGQYAWNAWLFGSSNWPLSVNLVVYYLNKDGAYVEVNGGAFKLDTPYLDLRVSCVITGKVRPNSLSMFLENMLLKETQVHEGKSMRTPHLWLELPSRLFRLSAINRALATQSKLRRLTPSDPDWGNLRRMYRSKFKLLPHQIKTMDMLKNTSITPPVLSLRNF